MIQQNSAFTMMDKKMLAMCSDSYERSVLLALKGFFPRIEPSVAGISKEAKCSHVTTIRKTASLVLKGIVIKIKGRRGQRNTYKINEAYLRPDEIEAQRRGTWSGVIKRARDFFRPKKAVNERSGLERKVVNHSNTNKNEYKQEGSCEPYLHPSESKRRAQEVLFALAGGASTEIRL